MTVSTSCATHKLIPPIRRTSTIDQILFFMRDIKQYKLHSSIFENAEITKKTPIEGLIILDKLC